MPLVRITLRKGKSAELLRDASNAVHDALAATANVPPDDKFHISECRQVRSAGVLAG